MPEDAPRSLDQKYITLSEHLSGPDRIAVTEANLRAHTERVAERVFTLDAQLAVRDQRITDLERLVAAQFAERERAIELLRENTIAHVDSADEGLRQHIQQQYKQIEAALNAAQRAQDKFEHDVEGRFKTVNEFRRALDDLGKNMATRRELETAIAASRDERQAVLSELRAMTARNTDEINGLRSRLDKGPEGLDLLRTANARRLGQHDAGLDFRVLMLGAIPILIAFAALIASIAH